MQLIPGFRIEFLGLDKNIISREGTLFTNVTPFKSTETANLGSGSACAKTGLRGDAMGVAVLHCAVAHRTMNAETMRTADMARTRRKGADIANDPTVYIR